MLGVCLNHGAPLGIHGMASLLLGAAARSSPATAQRRGQALQPRSGAPKARGLTATSGAKRSYNQAVVAA